VLKDFGQIPKRRLPSLSGLEWYQRTETSEPQRKVVEAEKATQSDLSPEAQMLLIRALTKDLDGAFRDIRAARADIEAIVEIPEARDRFQQWHKKKRYRPSSS
jgi:hypothetical protein